MENTMESYFTNSNDVQELSSDDFDQISTWKLKSHTCTAVLFYAPWCPWCKKVKDEWSRFGRAAKFMDVAAFDCEKYLSHLSKIKEDMPSLVKGFPTIIFYVNGVPVESFAGDRTYTNLLKAGMIVCQQAAKSS